MRIERTFSDPQAIARAIVAVAAAATIGWTTGNPLAGAMLPVGAFICSIGTLLSPVWHRAANASAMAVAFSAMALLGALVHSSALLFLTSLAVFAFIAGLCRTFGIAPGIRGCLAVIGLMITGDMAPDLHEGLIMAGWMSAGTALAVGTQLLPPYGLRYPAQRRTLSALYRALARASGASGASMPTQPFIAARHALGTLPRSTRPAAAALFGLLGTAEQLRRTMESVGWMNRTTGPTPHDDDVSQVLTDISRTVSTGRVQDTAATVWERLDRWAQSSSAASAERLVALLREAQRLGLLATNNRIGDAFEPNAEVPGLYSGTSVLARTASRLRGELNPHAHLFRHGVRLAVGVVIGELVGRGIGTWGGWGLASHGFWVALTTMLVLFPDYGHTMARGWGRSVGAILGGLLAWALSLADWSHGELAVASVALAAVALLTLRTGQLMLNLWLTAWLVFLIHEVGGFPAPTAWARAADTVVGAALAMAIFGLWPTWSTHRVPDVLSEWLRIFDRLLPEILTGYTAVGVGDPLAIDELRSTSRQIREQLHATIAQVESEPAHRRSVWNNDQLIQIQAEVDQAARYAALLSEHRPTTPPEAIPEFAELTDPVHELVGALARAAAGAHPVPRGTLRAAVDGVLDRAREQHPQQPSAEHARRRALDLCSEMTDTLENLAGIIATARR
ncbi:hypothetical protein HH308_02295 [Gordonia sp. TBRC 11910]|uniref:Integral membrane bound transporter domain-containing protein n=1 Tax=Gordonia asplenii TaxID=2725283 RepID=A0A848KP18_9ACTN|nr:FUSC family protein [Gordonia asplenii]NMO00040.1 hypothetical protein [Gordonia asplenii]